MRALQFYIWLTIAVMICISFWKKSQNSRQLKEKLLNAGYVADFSKVKIRGKTLTLVNPMISSLEAEKNLIKISEITNRPDICQVYFKKGFWILTHPKLIFRNFLFPKKSFRYKPKTKCPKWSLVFGIDMNGNNLISTDHSILQKSNSGSGKTIFLYQLILKALDSDFNVLIADTENSYSEFKAVHGVAVFDMTDKSEMENFAKLVDGIILNFQHDKQFLNLADDMFSVYGVHKTLNRPTLIICDEAERYLNETKDDDLSLKSRLIQSLGILIKQGRKYGIKTVISTQTNFQSKLPVFDESQFSAQIYSKTTLSISRSKLDSDVLTSSHLVKGVFYYIGKNWKGFFKTPLISKNEIKGFLNAKKS